ncbi:proteic killer suppression protein [Duganella sp. 1411]|uniref:type II toxin-antitoxin system RelE/ParE family toxin n=1 Tax=Duganella sp. 1411 TaxID=2806572 RepID=UPI001AE52C1B|nr:type II toxin-antitoxin system RelE/ParE family toxin [Duganella sp. 1411]MBP1203873.1 proteic killer suppression protein [Duganella sp. 1411]
MIRSFASKDTEWLFFNRKVLRFGHIDRVARRKLLMIHAAMTLSDLSGVPGNRLEMLSGSRQGQYSIRINDQWRICFRWQNGNAYDLEIVDYH